ncbi:MAG: class I SAM-dependent methyltransferase [Chloroflexi bacterium]|nr:MAG: class I SAM-dependent methyltransferase [Chloroflexota bacterium]
MASGDRAPRRVVDVGCGTGRLLAQLHERLPDAELVGVDPSAGMVAQARTRLGQQSRVRIEVTPASALPLEDRSVDAVVTTISFHHWDDQPASLGEISRVLRDGGRLLVADLLAIGLAGQLAARFGRRHGHGYRTEEELGGLFRAAGFTQWSRRRLFGPASPLYLVDARVSASATGARSA